MPMPGKAVRSSPRRPTYDQPTACGGTSRDFAGSRSFAVSRSRDRPDRARLPSLLDIANRKEQTRCIASQMAKL